MQEGRSGILEIPVSQIFSSKPKVQHLKSLEKDEISQHLVGIIISSHCLPKCYSSQNTPGDIKASQVRFYGRGATGNSTRISRVSLFSVPKTLLYRIYGVP